MRFLITGSSGFIGYNLSKKLLDENHEVIGVDNHAKDGSEKLKQDRLKILQKYKKFSFKKKDVSKKFSDLKFDKKIDFIIHLAAQPGVRISINKPLNCIHSNIIGTFEIFEFARINKISKLMYASSSTVYGERAVNFVENLITSKPKSIYAISKINNEMLSDYYYNEFKISSVGIRFFSIYGIMGRKDMSYYKFLDDIKKKKKIIVNGDGTIKRSFTHISDATECLVRLINCYKKERNFNEIYNVGNSETISINRIIKIIKSNINTPFKIIYKKKFGVDNFITKCDTKKLFKKIKFKPKVPIEKGLIDFVKWHNGK